MAPQKLFGMGGVSGEGWPSPGPSLFRKSYVVPFRLLKNLGVVGVGDDIAELAGRTPGWHDAGREHERAGERRGELLARRQVVGVDQPPQRLRPLDRLACEGALRRDRRLWHNQPSLARPQDIEILLMAGR